MRDLGEQERLLARRLALQRAAREGDLETLLAQGGISQKEGLTLFQIATLHGHEALVEHLASLFPGPSSFTAEVDTTPLSDEDTFKSVYGFHALMDTVAAEDEREAAAYPAWADEMALMRARWEQGEAEERRKLST